MEECEALCTRLVIMVNGQFKCLGSPQHLKTKFGNGYKLAIRLNDENDSGKLDAFMLNSFPSSTIQESHKNLFEYVLPFKDTKLSQVFGQIEKNRDYLNLKDYSVSQTTLDQIFVNFAKGQNEEKSNSKVNSEIIDAYQDKKLNIPTKSSQANGKVINSFDTLVNSKVDSDKNIYNYQIKNLPKKNSYKISDSTTVLQVTKI